MTIALILKTCIASIQSNKHVSWQCTAGMATDAPVIWETTLHAESSLPHESIRLVMFCAKLQIASDASFLPFLP